MRKIIKMLSAPVAQLDRALGYGPGGSGFKSRARHIMIKRKKALTINNLIFLSLVIKIIFAFIFSDSFG